MKSREKENIFDSVEIIFEDEFIVVVNKPANLLTIPDHWVKEKPNLITWLREERPERTILIVHRLDLETSGLLVFAKSPEAHVNLCQQFELHTIEKVYFGIVQGAVAEDSGRIELALAANHKERGTMMVQENGKPAVTVWSVLERFHQYALLRIVPESGRLHQIRVHLRAIGHPLLADGKYGDRTPVYLSQLKKKYIPKPEQAEKPLLGRLALHAGAVRVRHPQTGELVNFECPIPRDLNILLKNLRKYRGRV
jgi:RluA family pseudouridine synthase